MLEDLRSENGKLPERKNARKKELNFLLLDMVLLAMSWKSLSNRLMMIEWLFLEMIESFVVAILPFHLIVDALQMILRC